jgi:regulator of RNase E activity RraA
MTKAIDLDRLRAVAYSAVVSDCCDRLGLRTQTLDPGIVPTGDASAVLIGFARPVRSVPVASIPERPYEAEIDFIDSLRKDDVVVATVEPPVAFWGELFSAAAHARGAVGAVIDGLVRDQARMATTGFRVFARGGRPTDSLGRTSIGERDRNLVIGGVTVAPGDLIVADIDGVVVVPADATAEVTSKAIEKATTETAARRLLTEGALLRDAWDRYGVL